MKIDILKLFSSKTRIAVNRLRNQMTNRDQSSMFFDFEDMGVFVR